MNQSKWIVESTHLRMRPEIEKPLIFGHASTVAAHQQYKEINDFYNKTLASQPTIKRGDNGQWKEGDVLTEGVDFEIQYMYYNGEKWVQTTAFLYEKYLNKRQKVAIPKQQESEEGEFELLLQLQSAFRDIEKLSFKEAMKAKEELLTHYSIKRK